MAFEVPSTQKFEESGYLTKTANGAGWQINALDEYGVAFVEYARTTKRPIADLGVAFGFTSRCLLEAGAHVIANDLSEEMLQELEKSVTATEQKKRLTLMPGDARELNFPENSLDGIWANRCFQFFTPHEMRAFMDKFHTWLAPGGKLCITVATPYILHAANFLPTYLERKKNGAEWPGFITAEEMPEMWKTAAALSTTGHVIDQDVLEREVLRAGFTVEKCSYIARGYASTNGKEGVGIIAIK